MQSFGMGILEFILLILAFVGCGFVGTKLCERTAIVRSGTNMDVVIFLATGVAGALIIGWIWESL